MAPPGTIMSWDIMCTRRPCIYKSRKSKVEGPKSKVKEQSKILEARLEYFNFWKLDVSSYEVINDFYFLTFDFKVVMQFNNYKASFNGYCRLVMYNLGFKK